MSLTVHYIMGKVFYILPKEFILTYIIFIVRYLFAGYILSYYFLAEYTVITMAISILIADFKFYINIYDILEHYDEKE